MMLTDVMDEIVTWIEETINSQNATGRWSLPCTIDQTCNLVLTTASAKSSNMNTLKALLFCCTFYILVPLHEKSVIESVSKTRTTCVNCLYGRCRAAQVVTYTNIHLLQIN